MPSERRFTKRAVVRNAVIICACDTALWSPHPTKLWLKSVQNTDLGGFGLLEAPFFPYSVSSMRTRRLQNSGLLAFAALCILACGGSSTAPETPAGSQGDDRLRAQCSADGHRVVEEDLNGDSVSDIRTVYEGETPICIQANLDGDSAGCFESTRYFDNAGNLLREDQNLDYVCDVDQILYYENDQVVRVELDTNHDRRIDFWTWCENGLLARAERDRRHGGRPDVWERYDQGVLVEVRKDENNDGEPDRWDIYQDGRILEIRRDSNADGTPDQTETVIEAARGTAEPAQGCDGVVAQTPAPTEPAPPAQTQTTAAPTEAAPTEAAPTEAAPTETTDTAPDAAATEGTEQ